QAAPSRERADAVDGEKVVVAVEVDGVEAPLLSGELGDERAGTVKRIHGREANEPPDADVPILASRLTKILAALRRPDLDVVRARLDAGDVTDVRFNAALVRM